MDNTINSVCKYLPFEKKLMQKITLKNALNGYNFTRFNILLKDYQRLHEELELLYSLHASEETIKTLKSSIDQINELAIETISQMEESTEDTNILILKLCSISENFKTFINQTPKIKKTIGRPI